MSKPTEADCQAAEKLLADWRSVGYSSRRLDLLKVAFAQARREGREAGYLDGVTAAQEAVSAFARRGGATPEYRTQLCRQINRALAALPPPGEGG
jgi:hypothetical protein